MIYVRDKVWIYFRIVIMLGVETMNIPIVFALNDEYALPTFIALESLLKSAKVSTFYHIYYLVPNEFSTHYIQQIEKLKTKYSNFSFVSINMKDAFKGAYIRLEHISEQTYYRLLLPELLQEWERCLYLDGDVLVRDDLAMLYSSLCDDNYLAGVKSPGYHLNSSYKEKASCDKIGIESYDNYVNAGVLVFNLKKMREDKITGKLLNIIKKNLPSQDQDALNVVCYSKIQQLPLKYNVPVLYRNQQDELKKVFTSEEVEEARREPIIVHFAGGYTKPWKNRNVIYADEWWDIAEVSGYDLEKLKMKESNFVWKSQYPSLLLRLNAEREIVVFGYSEISRKLVCQLEKRGINHIRYYCDNDARKWGREADKEICSLRDILEKCISPFFIIASQGYYRDIYSQLRENGINEDKIYRYKKLGEKFLLCLNEEERKKDYIL